MLPARHRLRRRADFTSTARGVRAGTPWLVVHARATAPSDCTRVGFVVSRAVGGAVVRNRTKRVLREQVRAWLVADATRGQGFDLVVRATPACPQAPTSVVRDALEDALRRSLAKARRVGPAEESR